MNLIFLNYESNKSLANSVLTSLDRWPIQCDLHLAGCHLGHPKTCVSSRIFRHGSLVGIVFASCPRKKTI